MSGPDVFRCDTCGKLESVEDTHDCPATPSTVPNAPGWWWLESFPPGRPRPSFVVNPCGVLYWLDCPGKPVSDYADMWQGRCYTQADLDAARAEKGHCDESHDKRRADEARRAALREAADDLEKEARAFTKGEPTHGALIRMATRFREKAEAT